MIRLLQQSTFPLAENVFPQQPLPVKICVSASANNISTTRKNNCYRKNNGFDQWEVSFHYWEK